ncbi:MAG: helix-turn-helix transcriptional regulator [Planctomycetes bacterium]|nr:helix-turn-helix transcriptional regulator [Planctomycetota bacterium]
MVSESEHDVIVFDAGKLAAQIRAGCLRKGWNIGELARQAGVSRTTLYHLERGATRKPRYPTVQRIAAALGISPESVCEPSPKQPEQLRNISDRTFRGSRVFDRATNNEISEVHHEFPELFSGWADEEWDELYSTFGEGGPLNQQGVVEFAQQINRKRDTLHKLQVVLETHLCPVAVNLIETLYGMIHIPSKPAEDDDSNCKP